jgi:hypothetical protein
LVRDIRDYVLTPTGTVKEPSGSRKWHRIFPEVMVRIFRNCCIYVEWDGWGDEEEGVNVGSDHGSVSMGTVKT